MTESVIALVQPIFFTRNKHKSLMQQEQALECYFFFFQHPKSAFLAIILPQHCCFFLWLSFSQATDISLSPVFFWSFLLVFLTVIDSHFYSFEP